MAKKPTKVTKELTLKDELKLLETSYQSYITRYQFSRLSRNYEVMAQFFGRKITDPRLKTKLVDRQDIEIYRGQIETIIKEKYASRKYLSPEFEEVNAESTAILLREIPKAERIPEEEEKINTSYVEKYPDQVASLLKTHCNQVKAARDLWINLEQGKVGQLLLAPTGSGKTYIIFSLLKNFIEQGWIKKLQCISPWPILYVTKASIVEQTKKVGRDEFGIDVVNTVHVINIELLRSQLGKLFVSEKIVVKQGVEHTEYTWVKWMHPCLVIWDECQILARADESIQGKIAQGINLIQDAPVIQIFASATPYSRPIEGKVFACSTRKKFQYGLQELTLCDETWKTFVNQISDPADPIEYNEASIKRFVDFFESHTVRIKAIRPKHKAHNNTMRLVFQTKSEHEEYIKAWERYQEKKRRIEGDAALTENQSRFALLAQFTIFRKAAEKIRRYHLAEFADKSWKAGKAPAIACAFKGTIVSVYKILVMDYGWKREDVSIIWGGSTEALGVKQKLSRRIKEAGLEELLKNQGLKLSDLGIEVEEIKEKSDEDYNFEKEHLLLTQKQEHREEERMRYQRQDSRLLLFTFKAGGVGLSAHHEDKYPKARPREGVLTPVYSEKELVQALGRLPRITSASDTSQTMCYYGNTNEEEVAARVIMKLKNLRQVTRGHGDSWEDVITGHKMMIEEESEEGEDIAEIDGGSVELLNEYNEKG
jgi:hypothetical protein